MTGNATEEWLMTRLDHPGHHDPARFGGLTGSACGIISGLVLNSYFGAATGLICGLLIGGLIGGTVIRSLKLRAETKRSEAMTSRREEQKNEQLRQIAAMKKAHAK